MAYWLVYHYMLPLHALKRVRSTSDYEGLWSVGVGIALPPDGGEIFGYIVSTNNKYPNINCTLSSRPYCKRNTYYWQYVASIYWKFYTYYDADDQHIAKMSSIGTTIGCYYSSSILTFQYCLADVLGEVSTCPHRYLKHILPFTIRITALIEKKVAQCVLLSNPLASSIRVEAIEDDR